MGQLSVSMVRRSSAIQTSASASVDSFLHAFGARTPEKHVPQPGLPLGIFS
jgi:hypothetical protein